MKWIEKRQRTQAQKYMYIIMAVMYETIRTKNIIGSEQKPGAKYSNKYTYTILRCRYAALHKEEFRLMWTFLVHSDLLMYFTMSTGFLFYRITRIPENAKLIQCYINFQKDMNQ